ncbi:hypothetical protein BU26DRAFT_520082 [Trematosphaeria pertusa]|uniref:5'-3' DNA helicase ZGRF1-like N-terminal domain-containing protein n=1 Tax=Trematosphaeria pertusa TaxID=390896 RepID=A0A6A6IDW5_9PLEO|nr:uncharacterized protein BU26DRAFT_520082 [Trematosphaeria pertusa]KAF2248397.1 hypothetical protein BU26DRAFT_520082 [Trematosphaeria pertusa]
MTAQFRSTPRLTAIPASQNTAPVTEFRCLFTHDVRRKQKRWQDGYLKFHTFNNRVMVYDTSRNFLGDTYWKESNEVQEGDALTLDKGVMVEVADAIGVTQTDLTPLFEKKTKESPQRSNAAPAQRPPSKPALPANNPLRAGSQLRHKSLNTLLGTPRGPIGKAVPIKSPFETKQRKENRFADERATKRQRLSHEPTHQTASSPVRDDDAAPKTNLPLWARTSDAKVARAPPKPIRRGAAVIALDSETDNISSDITLPSTPPGMSKPRPKPKATSASLSDQEVVRQPRPHTTPKLPKGKVPVPQVKAQETPRPPPQPSSPPVSASNRLSNVDFAVQPVRQMQKAPQQESRKQPLNEPQKELSPSQSPPRNPKARSLRLAAGVKRGILLCQAVPRPRAKAPPTEPIARPLKVGAKAKKNHVGRPSTDDPISLLTDDDVFELQNDPSGSRALSNEAKDQQTPSAATMGESEDVGVAQHSPNPSFDAFDDLELIHGLMDQQLIVTPPPPRPMSSPPPEAADLTPAPAKKASSRKKRGHEELPAVDPVPKTKKPKAAVAKEPSEKPQPKKKRAQKSQAPRKGSPTVVPAEAPAKQRRQDEPISLIEPSEEPSRDISTSMSPKKVALSTGGFQKKGKRAQPGPVNAEAPGPRPITIALPPHPLRANKSGPLMSTTELSALLQKTHKPVRVEDDPIEDGTQADKNLSPNRSFRRSRSENDAPIPSTSDDWAKRNLPKASKSDNDATTAVQAHPEPPKPKAGGLAALIKKTDPRRKFQRTQSLNVNTNVPTVEEVEVVTPPADDDVGPWSTEAFDLFDWRPPAKGDEDAGIGLFVDKR